MKKNILLAALIILAFNATAQLGIGVKGGFNRFALTGDDKSYIDRFHFGAFAQIPIKKMLVFQPEILFSAEGNGFEENGVKSGENLNYINLPLMIKLNTKSGFYLEAGPQIGLLLSAKFTESDRPDEDIKKFFKSTNISMGAGFGYQFKFGLGLSARYNFGITDLLKEANEEAMKSTGMQVGVFYRFSILQK